MRTAEIRVIDFNDADVLAALKHPTNTITR